MACIGGFQAGSKAVICPAGYNWKTQMTKASSNVSIVKNVLRLISFHPGIQGPLSSGPDESTPTSPRSQAQETPTSPILSSSELLIREKQPLPWKSTNSDQLLLLLEGAA